MRTALDSNILSALWGNEPSAAGIAKRLDFAKRHGAIVLSPIAYAELFGHPKMKEADIAFALDDLGVDIDFHLPEGLWSEAGRRFALYADRRRSSSGQSPKRLLADFVVGAHALLQADRLMTMDIARYERDFSELRLLRVEE